VEVRGILEFTTETRRHGGKRFQVEALGSNAEAIPTLR